MIVSFPKPGPLMSLNDRTHWAVKARNAKAWRELAHLSCIGTVSDPARRRQPRSLVTVTLPVRSLKTRRDPHNFVATVKPIIDGLVDAGVWPDDNGSWVVTAEPRFQAGNTVTVEIVPLEAPS